VPQGKAKEKHPQSGRQDSVPEDIRYLFSPLCGVTRKLTNVGWKTTRQIEVGAAFGQSHFRKVLKSWGSCLEASSNGG